MAKNIQWKKSTIDYNELNKVSPKKLGESKGGKTSSILLVNHEDRKEWCAMGGKAGGRKSYEAQVKSGQIDKFIAGGQRVRDEYWANVTDEKKADHLEKLWAGQQKIKDASKLKLKAVLNALPNTFTTQDMYAALESQGYCHGSKALLHKKYLNVAYTKIKRGNYKKIA